MGDAGTRAQGSTPRRPLADLAGKVAVVTGGGNGVGERVAHTLAEMGSTVVIVDRDAERGEAVTRSICDGGHQAQFINADVTVEDEIRDFVREIRDRHGRIDILDNNAAALELTIDDGSVVDVTLPLLMNTLTADIVGPFLMCKHTIPVMLENGAGSIVNMASVTGLLGEENLSAYGVAKAGVIQLTRMVATQFGAQGIRSNAIAPSYVTTRNNEIYAPPELAGIYRKALLLSDNVDPQSIADVVAFLASDASRKITGQTIPVDAGLSVVSPMVAVNRLARLSPASRMPEP